MIKNTYNPDYDVSDEVIRDLLERQSQLVDVLQKVLDETDQVYIVHLIEAALND